MLALDVVVRTLADAERSSLLWRALESIQDQNGISARPIVVVNGERYDNATLTALENRPGILLHCLRQASAGLARIEGCRLVTAPYFSFLDDDDELIADSLLEPLRWIENHPDCDVLINNGYFVKKDGSLAELIHIAEHISVNQPALSLMDDSWLQPGAFIFRTKSVPPDILSANWSHQEWTHLAFQLCSAHKRLHFMDVPTVFYYDTPGSLSKQMQQGEAALDLLQLIRHDVRMNAKIRRKANRKYRNTLHVLAMKAWEAGQVAKAWRYHLASLYPPGTLKYLLSSRKLLWPFSKRPIKSSGHPTSG